MKKLEQRFAVIGQLDELTKIRFYFKENLEPKTYGTINVLEMEHLPYMFAQFEIKSEKYSQ